MFVPPVGASPMVACLPQLPEIEALTRAMARGDDDAFRTFHQHYFDRLYRYHIVLARGDETVARDGVQETFIRVARHIKAFSSESAFWGWLTVLARSAAVDAARKRNRYWRLISSYASELLPNYGQQRGVSEDQILTQVLQECLDSLDATDRHWIEQKYFANASIRDLAEVSSLTERAVEARLFRIRRALRLQMEKKLNETDK